MPERRRQGLRPALERLEKKQTMSASGAVATAATPGTTAETPAQERDAAILAREQAVAARQQVATRALVAQSDATGSVAPDLVKPNTGYLVYRLTNPGATTDRLTPPFGHVLVQQAQPVPGQVYNVLSVSVKNNTSRTFTAADGFEVKFPGQTYFTPILTGDETWSPEQDYIFYVLTKKYYPIQNTVTGGFLFILGGAPSVAVPGPSGIFLGIRYNPDTIDKVLDYIVTKGPGAEGGAGIATGLADTAIYAFTTAQTDRKDFGGYF